MSQMSIKVADVSSFIDTMSTFAQQNGIKSGRYRMVYHQWWLHSANTNKIKWMAMWGCLLFANNKINEMNASGRCHNKTKNILKDKWSTLGQCKYPLKPEHILFVCLFACLLFVWIISFQSLDSSNSSLTSCLQQHFKFLTFSSQSTMGVKLPNQSI